jgi:hypothetical protein
MNFCVLVAALSSQGLIAAGIVQDTSLFFSPNLPILFFYVKRTLKFKLYSGNMSLA